MTGNATKVLAKNLTNGVALDYDWRKDCVYWSEQPFPPNPPGISRMCRTSPDAEYQHQVGGRPGSRRGGVGGGGGCGEIGRNWS